MSIPETQFETWSHQGSITQSSDTYNPIRNALLDSSAPYANHKFSVFLQGSYGNNTNIRSESDVDIVVALLTAFYYDLSELTPIEKQTFGSAYPTSAVYSYGAWKKEVTDHLVNLYGDAVKVGKKAISIEGNGSRRKADVIVANQFREYVSFASKGAEQFREGICFFTTSGEQVINYPKQHSINCTEKHQRTGKWFKPVVRIFKNMRSRLVADGMLDKRDAPSYYVEGMLHDVPDDAFGTSYKDTFVRAYDWLIAADRAELWCPNQQYKLFGSDPHVQWSAERYDRLLKGLRQLWDDWYD